MTPAEARKFIEDRLTAKIRASLDRDDFQTAFGNLPPAARDQIIGAALERNGSALAAGIDRMLDIYARQQANTRATAIIADGSLDLAEFSEIFDP